TGCIRSKLLVGAALSLLVVCGGTGSELAHAAAPAAATDAKASKLDPNVTKLLQDASNALKTGNVNLAIIQLKNAVQLAPSEPEPRAQLGSALLQQPGSAVA